MTGVQTCALPIFYRSNYARYAAEAKLKNIQLAAEKLIAERLAAEKAAAQNAQSEAPLDVTNVPVVTAATRKQPTPADSAASSQEAKITA